MLLAVCRDERLGLPNANGFGLGCRNGPLVEVVEGTPRRQRIRLADRVVHRARIDPASLKDFENRLGFTRGRPEACGEGSCELQLRFRRCARLTIRRD